MGKRILPSYWKIRKQIANPSGGAQRTACKHANSSYAINLYNASQLTSINQSNTPYFNDIDNTDTMFSMSFYNKVKDAVRKHDSEYFVQIDDGRVTTETEVAMHLIQTSVTAYAMLNTIWRSQNGYLTQDEDMINVGAVYLNHDTKGVSTVDWTISSNNSFAEEILHSSMITQTQIQTSGQIPFTFGVSNEAWNNEVEYILNHLYLNSGLKKVADHLFRNVFVDPAFSYNARTVTFFPASTIRRLSTTVTANDFDFSNYDNLTGYDSTYLKFNPGPRQTYSEDNTPTWAGVITYFDHIITDITNMTNYYPFLRAVLADLGFSNSLVSVDEFKRSQLHNEIYFIQDENVQDFVQSTAVNSQNLEAPMYQDSFVLFNETISFSVKDEELLKYGKGLEYADECEISTVSSFEYLFKGKVRPLRFAYYGADDNLTQEWYRFHYLVPSTGASIGTSAGQFTTAQALSLMYINTDLADFGAVIPVQNDHYSTHPSNGMGAAEMSVVPSLRTYYNAGENLGLDVQAAWDSILSANSKKKE